MVILKTTRVCAAMGAALALVCSGISVAMPATAGPNDGEAKNVALASAGATVTASGNEVNNKWQKEKAIDGSTDPDSRWSSNRADNAWLAVHLAAPARIHHVTIQWEQACAARYHLEVSSNGTDWVRASHAIRPTCGAGGEPAADTQTLLPAVANQQWQYVKMQAEDRTPFGGQKWGVSLYEFEVWTGQAPTPPPAPAALSLIPKPAVLQQPQAESFVLQPDSRLIVKDEKARSVAQLLQAELKASIGFELPLATSGETAKDIVFVGGDVDGFTSPEEYALTASAEGVRVTANQPHGFFNATRTIKQLLPAAALSAKPQNAQWVMPAVAIKDAPRFAYRGVMIDPARSFFTVDEVKRIIDQMADLKLSRLHMHLADDQGWRIQITNEGKDPDDPIDYNRLTDVMGKAAINTHELAHSKELGRTGFYTQDEYRDIVAYGEAKFVTIVPEIDMPGHMNAALRAIPQLNTATSSHPLAEDGETAPENPTGQVGYSYLDPNSPVSWHFMKHVLSQVAQMTTGEELHIGGDEPFAMRQALGQEVYNKTLARILSLARDLGKKPLGWSEIADTTLHEGDTIHFWVGHQEAINRQVRENHAKVLMSLGPKAYLDQKYNSKTPIALNWACQGECDMKQYYQWNPINAGGLSLTEDSVRGVEGALWNETVRGGDQGEFLIWPRSAAIGEVGWTPQNKRSVADFLKRMSAQGVRWNVQQTNFYDGNQAVWDYQVLAPKQLSAPPATAVKFPIGQLSAPGTVLAENALSADTNNDADGVSRSKIPANTRVSIDWGDGTQATVADIEAPRPRDAYGAPALYRLGGNHTYVTPGEYTVTLTAGERTATTKIRVAADASTPQLPAKWDSSQTPSLEVERNTASPTDRVKVSIRGFEPDKLVDIHIGDVLVGQFRPDADGNRLDQYMFIPESLVSGSYQLTFTQGDRVAKTPFTITNGRVVLDNPLPIEDLSISEVSSQELSGEKAPNGPAAAAIDGDPHTFWHTKWQNGEDNFPHHITFKLNENKTCKLTGFEYTGRANMDNTRVKDYRIEVSDDGQQWRTVYTGKLKNVGYPQAVNFAEDQQVEARYVKMTQLNAHNGRKFGGAAEIRLGALCADPATQPTTVPTATPSTDTTTAPPAGGVDTSTQTDPEGGKVDVGTQTDPQKVDAGTQTDPVLPAVKPAKPGVTVTPTPGSTPGKPGQAGKDEQTLKRGRKAAAAPAKPAVAGHTLAATGVGLGALALVATGFAAAGAAVRLKRRNA